MQNKRTIWIMLAAPFILLAFFFALPHSRDSRLDSPQYCLGLLLQAMQTGDQQKIRERTTANGWNDLHKFHDDANVKTYVIYKTFQELGATQNELTSPVHIWSVWTMWARQHNVNNAL